MSSKPKILIFDSGAGGLSIATEILLQIPNTSLIYAADKGYFPYGLKNDQALTERIVSQVEKLYESHHPDLVVIACNTASTLALDTLRAEFPCPFVGVVPAIKPASKLTQTGVIGVLATEATVKRQYTQDLIQDFAADHDVHLHGSDALVNEAEKKVLGQALDLNVIFNELDQLFERSSDGLIDTVVLACTHFPLLKDEFAQWSKANDRDMTWVDSGRAIANRVVSQLQIKNLPPSTNVELVFELLELSEQALYRQYLLNASNR